MNMIDVNMQSVLQLIDLSTTIFNVIIKYSSTYLSVFSDGCHGFTIGRETQITYLCFTLKIPEVN